MKTIRRHKKIVIVIIAILLCLGYVLNRFVGGKIRLENSAIKKYYGGYYDITPFAERGNVKKNVIISTKIIWQYLLLYLLF